jgi:hypothetical protein
LRVGKRHRGNGKQGELPAVMVDAQRHELVAHRMAAQEDRDREREA